MSIGTLPQSPGFVLAKTATGRSLHLTRPTASHAVCGARLMDGALGDADDRRLPLCRRCREALSDRRRVAR